ncbi:MAG: hypothetical protein RMJ84_01025 [Sandaracinaceae bacterium]|nr:hypothetical protein [Sandaracinaceae bacterium]
MALAPPPEAEEARVKPTFGATSISDLPAPLVQAQKKDNFTLRIALIAFAFLVITSFIAIGAWFLLGGGVTVQASIRQEGGKEYLHLQLKNTDPNALVKVGKEERRASKGVVDFPFDTSSLKVGENTLHVLVQSKGKALNIPISLRLDHRVRTDLSGLLEDPPFIAVVVEALPGSKVSVEGNPVNLDQEGRGVHRFMLSEFQLPEKGSWNHSFSYSITLPDGSKRDGSLSFRIPPIQLSIRQPLDGAITDRPSVKVIGRIMRLKEGVNFDVRVNGNPVTVDGNGEFASEVALGPPSEEPYPIDIVARSDRHLPRTIRVMVKRVPDLLREATNFNADSKITYAQLMNTPESIRGKRIVVEGKVYNVDVQDGRGVLQILMQGCTPSTRCPLWVNYAPAEQIEKNTMVRVFGVAAGLQGFRSQQGEDRIVPRIDATIVLVRP